MAHKGLLKDLILPYELTYESKSYTNSFGRFSLYPFDKGVGVTIVNSLRRVLLSTIPGYAITSVKFEGVNHEFETMEGVKEDITDIILAIKKIHIALVDGSDKKKIRLSKKGKGELMASDFQVDPTIQVVNGDLKIATLNDDADISMEVQIEFGRGYRSAEDEMDSNSIISEIPIDAIFSPIIKVNYTIEDYRVGEKTDCEKVLVELTTDGTIDPIDAMSDGAAILKKYFSMLVNFEEEEEILPDEVIEEEEELVTDITAKPIEDLDLSVRSYNCLKSAEVNTIGLLLEYDRDSLMKIKNFGKKSLTEISEKLVILGLNLKGEEADEAKNESDKEESSDE